MQCRLFCSKEYNLQQLFVFCGLNTVLSQLKEAIQITLVRAWQLRKLYFLPAANSNKDADAAVSSSKHTSARCGRVDTGVDTVDTLDLLIKGQTGARQPRSFYEQVRCFTIDSGCFWRKVNNLKSVHLIKFVTPSSDFICHPGN